MNPTETAPRDNNSVPTRLAVLNTDTVQGQHLVPIEITASGAIQVNRTSTINFSMQPVDPKDENYVNCWLFEGTDGLTYPAVADEGGALLIDM